MNFNPKGSMLNSLRSCFTHLCPYGTE